MIDHAISIEITPWLHVFSYKASPFRTIACLSMEYHTRWFHIMLDKDTSYHIMPRHILSIQITPYQSGSYNSFHTLHSYQIKPLRPYCMISDHANRNRAMSFHMKPHRNKLFYTVHIIPNCAILKQFTPHHFI